MLFDYECNKCGFKDEYSTSPSVPKDMKVPSKCPECGKGKMKKLLSLDGQSFDCPGAYDYEWGKKAWKKRMSSSEKAQVLLGEKSPY